MKNKNLDWELRRENSSSPFQAPDIESITSKVKCHIEKDSSHYERKTTIMAFKKRFAIAAMCAVLVLGVTVFAAEYGGNVIKMITTGYNSYVQVDPDAPQPLPEELVGKIFDENGVVLESLTRKDIDNMYNENGEKITQEMYAEMIEELTGGLVKVGYDYNPEESEKTFESLEDAQANTVFDIKAPVYLPEGYELERVYTYKDDDGSVSGEYMTIVYSNSEGKEITFFERILNENTAFEVGTDGTLEEVAVNGKESVIINGRTLYLETEDNVSVCISTHGNITREELVNIAGSVN